MKSIMEKNANRIMSETKLINDIEEKCGEEQRKKRGIGGIQAKYHLLPDFKSLNRE